MHTGQMGTKRTSQTYQHPPRQDKYNDTYSDSQASHTSTTHTTLKRHGHTRSPTRTPRTSCLCNPSCEARERPTLTVNTTRQYAPANHTERRANLSAVLQNSPTHTRTTSTPDNTHCSDDAQRCMGELAPCGRRHKVPRDSTERHPATG